MPRAKNILGSKLRIAQYVHDEYKEAFRVDFKTKEFLEVSGLKDARILGYYLKQEFSGMFIRSRGNIFADVLAFGSRKKFLEGLRTAAAALENPRYRTSLPTDETSTHRAGFAGGRKERW